MIGGLIVTHGRLSFELLNAAQTIEGQLEHLEAVALDWNDTVDEARKKIGEALGRVDDASGVIIFTDMFGGTPSNISISFLELERVEVVTGVNLPMIVKFASLRGDQRKLAELAHLIREKGSKSIRVASDLLSKDTREQGNGT